MHLNGRLLAIVAEAHDKPDLRCCNENCDLYQLKLEPDEVDAQPGDTPDKCAECGGELAPYTGD